MPLLVPVIVPAEAVVLPSLLEEELDLVERAELRDLEIPLLVELTHQMDEDHPWRVDEAESGQRQGHAEPFGELPS